MSNDVARWLPLQARTSALTARAQRTTIPARRALRQSGLLCAYLRYLAWLPGSGGQDRATSRAKWVNLRIVACVFAYAVAGPQEPGYAIVTDRFVVLLSAEVSAATVREVHRLLDTPAAAAESAIARLSQADGAERFAVVEIVDPWTQSFQVSVRGDIRVDMGGASTTSFTWPQRDKLLQGEAIGVESLLLALGGSPTGAPTLPLRHGAVAAHAIALDGVELAKAPSDVAPAALGHTDEADDAESHDDTVISQRTPEEPAPELDTAAATTRQAPLTPAAVTPRPQPTRASAVVHALDEDDRRPQPVDLAELMANSPSQLWTLTLPDGNELFAAPQIVVGRRPWRSDPDETQTYYVKAPSPHREISGKHVEFTVAGGRLSARDLDSTNGTVVESPDRPPRLLKDGNATQLDVGDVLDLGEGFRIVVGARSGS